jgi:hypothetical protein
VQDLQVFAQATAWQPDYEEPAALLSSGSGHLPEMAAKEQQVDPGATGCNDTDGLMLPLMREQGRFVDQEVLSCGEV